MADKQQDQDHNVDRPTTSGTSTSSASTSRVGRRRRGPYKKGWAELYDENRTTGINVTCDDPPLALRTADHHQEDMMSEPDEDRDDIPEKQSKMCSDDDYDRGEDVCAESDDDDKDVTSEYSPPKDHQDNLLDKILTELQEVVQEEKYHELADDFAETAETLAYETPETLESEVPHVVTPPSETAVEDEPLYQGCKRKVGVVMLMLTVFMIRFRLADETMQHLLQLIALLLPDHNRFFSSLYLLRKHMSKYLCLPEVLRYCSFCFAEVEKDCTRCPNVICKNDLTDSGAIAYLVKHSIIKQLQLLFKRNDFLNTVRTHRFKHIQGSGRNIRDVYDAKLYRNLFDSGFLSNPNNISFAMNTDGVPIFKSSKISMWPVYLYINELPLKERKMKSNFICYGIWIAEKKPVMWRFLEPLADEISKLENGVEFVDNLGENFMCHATLLTCTCDLPAKCMVTNSIQFNGKYGCWHCLQPGSSFVTPAGGTVHVFPFQKDSPKDPLRTPMNVREDVTQAVHNLNNNMEKYMVNGVKGPSRLMKLRYFNIVQGLVIDYMHGVCSGVMKLLLTLWFNNSHKKEAFSHFSMRDNVSKAIKQIKPTLQITRIPRSLDALVNWKSSEYRNFLLYWGVPVLCNLLKSKYFMHFTLLVQATFVLSKESITGEDIDKAEQSLFQFVEEFPELYSLRYMTLNMHQLVHLADNVRWTGPLFSNNCFSFEDLNGFIVQQIHGTQGIATQVVNTLNLIQVIPLLEQKYYHLDHEVAVFIDTIQGHLHNTWHSIDGNFFFIGSFNWITFSPGDLGIIRRKHPSAKSSGKCYLKIYVKETNSLVYASEYKKMTRRDQSCIRYVDGSSSPQYGSVKRFVEFEDNSQFHIIAFVAPFVMNNYSCENGINKVKPSTGKITAVPLHSIQQSCIHVNIDNTHFICELPNRYDRD